MVSSPPDPISDLQRLDRLRATGLLDAPTDEAFDRLTRLASKLLDAPVSTVTLVDVDRQFYMSCVGMPEPLASIRETPLELSFCRHTVVLGRPLIVPDTRGHPVVGEVPAITQFGVLAYAGIPLLTADGFALGTLCVMDFRVRDWTDDQVASLADLAAAVSTEIELRMDIAERRRVERELQQAVGLRDQVLAVVSHDLRNPVHTIGLSVGLLLDDYLAATDVSELRAQIGVIGRAAERMGHMIGDLLDAASIASGALSVQPRPTGAAALLAGVYESFAPLAAERELQLTCVPCDPDLRIQADPDRVFQVLSNLLGNAAKFTPSGGRIEVAAEADGAQVRFSVADTGRGIAPDHLPHIFEPFWQAHRAGREGVGLGLGIAHGIVAAHGGTIWAESNPGAGSVFRFTIPRAS